MIIKAAILRQIYPTGLFRDSKPLQIETVELDPPQAEEVLIQIKAAGLCHSDLVAIDGERPKPMPIVLGHETMGIVAEVGPNVTAFEVGQLRSCRWTFCIQASGRVKGRCFFMPLFFDGGWFSWKHGTSLFCDHLLCGFWAMIFL